MRLFTLKITGGVTGLTLAIFTMATIMTVTPMGEVNAAGDPDAGSTKAKACQVCHGKGGNSSNPSYPRLAGQHAKYIVKQLKAFKAGTRKDPIMNGMAATLSEQDMEDVAAFFERNG